MTIRLLNKTTGNYVRDADSDIGAICEFDFLPEALRALDQVNDLKQLNPHHAADEIVLSYYDEP